MCRINSLASRLDRLGRRLGKFGFPLVVQPLAGLLTRPDNHTASLRIEALIHLAAFKCRGTQAPTVAQLREWLNQIIFRDQITALEDPVEDVFVSNVATWFGNARLFEGGWSDNDHYVQACLAALSQLKDRPWAVEAQQAVIALLRLSEAVAERAGVQRFTMAASTPRRPLKITAATVDPSRTHVTFSLEDIFALGIRPSDLNPFVFQSEHAAALAQETLGHTSLERRPLLRSAGQTVVALPTAIGAAIRRYIVERAIEVQDLDALQSTVAVAQFHDVFHLGRVGWCIETQEPPSPTEPAGAMDFVGTFDDGGYVHLIFVPDDLGEAASNGLQGVHSIEGVIDKRIDEHTTALAARPDYRRGLTFIVHGGIGRGFLAGFREPPEGWQRLCLGIADFMRLGWDSDMTALRAWKLLDQEDALRERGVTIANINGFLNLYAYARHQNFELVPEVVSLGRIMLATDYLTPLRHRLRVTLDQHAAIAPDRKSWIEVQREATSVFFREAQNLPVFISPGHATSGEFLTCIETGARPWWIRCNELPSSERHRSIVLQVWEMARNWLIPLAPALERRLLSLPSGPITFHLRFPDIDNSSDDLFLMGGAVSPPAIEIHNGQALIGCPSTYLQSFTNAQNIGDRFMVAALVRATYALAGDQPSDTTVDALVQEVVGDDEARFFHAVPATTLRQMIYAVLPLPSPRMPAPEDCAWSRLNLARTAGWTGPVGLLPADQAGLLLNEAVTTVWERIKDRLLMLNRVSVIERALLNHDSIEQDRTNWRLTAAALLAIYDDAADIVQAANKREGQRGLAGLASRVIAEMALCTAPLDGGVACTGADLDFLIAEVATLLDCAGESDALRYGLAARPPVVHANGSFGFDFSFSELLLQPYMEGHGERSFRAAAAKYASAFNTPEGGGTIDANFEAAFTNEFGVSLEQLFEFAERSVRDALERCAPHYRVARSMVLRLLSDVGAPNPERTFGALALTPRPRWDEDKPKDAKSRDWYPWRYHRRLSLTRRPLVQLSNDDDPEVLIAPTLIDRTIRYLCEAASGRLPSDLFDSRPMKKWIGGAVDRGGHEFNRQVAARLSEQLGYEVRPELRLTLLGGSPELGDIDVLAWRPEAGVVYAIECKRLLFARTVGEIGERLAEYTSVVEAGNDRTPIQKHLDRIQYLKVNLVQLSDVTKIPSERLQLRSALVTDYLVPMQFSERTLTLMDVVTDYALLDQAFG